MVGVEELEAEEGENHLHREGAAVHEVPIEYLGGAEEKQAGAGGGKTSFFPPRSYQDLEPSLARAGFQHQEYHPPGL